MKGPHPDTVYSVYDNKWMTFNIVQMSSYICVHGDAEAAELKPSRREVRQKGKTRKK